jgi:hypothetical protein
LIDQSFFLHKFYQWNIQLKTLHVILLRIISTPDYLTILVYNNFPIHRPIREYQKSIYIVRKEGLWGARTYTAILHTLEIRCDFSKVVRDTPIS